MNLNVYIYNGITSLISHSFSNSIESHVKQWHPGVAFLPFFDWYESSIFCCCNLCDCTYYWCCFFCCSFTSTSEPNPISELERIDNDLRIKYITYTVELDVLNVIRYWSCDSQLIFLTMCNVWISSGGGMTDLCLIFCFIYLCFFSLRRLWCLAKFTLLLLQVLVEIMERQSYVIQNLWFFSIMQWCFFVL